MIQFWLIASVMVVMALLLIIPPLFRGDKNSPLNRKQQNIAIAKERFEDLMADLVRGDITRDQYSQARSELEQALYDDLDGLESTTRPAAPRGRWAATVIGITLPTIACGLYFLLGTPEAVDLKNNPSAHIGTSSSEQVASIDAMAEKLRNRLQSQPDDVKGWLMLARTYQVMGRDQQSVDIMAAVYQLDKDNPDVLVQYAYALIRTNGGNFEGQPAAMVSKALTRQPFHQSGLWLAGMAAAQKGQYAQALAQWQKLEPLLAEAPQDLQRLQGLIQQTRRKIGVTPPQTTPTSVSTQDRDPTVEKMVRVAISLDSSLANKISENDSLFIYAQALSGPPMPLAVVRTTAGSLPLDVELNDDLAMMPAMKISKFAQVRISARISKSGDAIPRSGDFRGQVEPVKVGDSSVVRVIIKERVP